MPSSLQRCCQAVCCISQQNLTALLCFLSIVNQYTMRVCLNLAITEMVLPKVVNATANGTLIRLSPCGVDLDGKAFMARGSSPEFSRYAWDETTQGLILSAFFWGYVASHFASAFIADKYPRLLLGLSVLITAVLTLLTPLAIDIGGAPLLMATRAIEGVGEGATFPVLSAIIGHWIPPDKRGMLGSFIYSGGQIGSLVGGIGTGLIISKLHSWRLVFYVWGSLAIVWYLFWLVLGYASPETNPFISEEEKSRLLMQFADAKKVERTSGIPWSQICKSVPLWALIIGQVGHDWGFYLLATDLPKYMKSILGVSVEDNGLISYFPFLCMWIFSVISGWICDVQIKKNCITRSNARKFWTTVGSLPPAIFIVAASYADCNKLLVVVYFALSVTFMGGFYPGLKVNVNDLSPNLAGVLMAMVNGIGAITGIVVPYLAGVLTPNQTVSEWRDVFWLAFWVLNATNVVFVLFGSGEIQPWNSEEASST
ncbi:hypothetical protein quinque_009386 [Culex quinquefasciatus]